MYEVYLDDELLYYPGDETLVILEPKLELADNKSGSFEFILPASNPFYDSIRELKSEVCVKKNGTGIFYGRCVSVEKDFYNKKSVICEGELAYLLDSIQEPRRYQNYTIRSFLTSLIDSHNAQVQLPIQVAVKFSDLCKGENGSYDYLSIYYRQGGTMYSLFGKKNANALAGQTFIIPAQDFYVYWRTDSSVNQFYGFSIDSVTFSDGEADLSAAAAASLPNYTVTEASTISDIQSAHEPYDNSSNLLWHYSYTLKSADQEKLNPKRFTVGMVTVTDPNDSIYRYTNWENTLEALQDKLVDRIGGHLRVRHSGTVRYLDYIEDYDNTNTQVIEFGENLLDYTENLDAADIATRVIPLGARLEEQEVEGLEAYTTIKDANGGVVYVESPAAVGTFGVVTRTVHFEDVTVPANLLSKGKKYLADMQFANTSLVCKAVDLNMVDGSVERIKLGDSIRVLSPPHGMDRYFPVTALTIYLQEPENNTVTLGTSVKAGLAERSTSDNQLLVQKINSIPPQSETLKLAQDNARALLTAPTTGHVITKPNEILIMDTADTATAKKVWRWNLNGLGYSKTGVNGSYGLAMTMDGAIVADYISTGTLSAERIKAGRIQDKKNLNYWDMDTGEFSLSSSTKVGTSTIATQKNVSDLDATFTQQKIFNKLTNNGQTQGIYLSGGKLYINADYISTGTLSADRVKAGTLSDKNGYVSWNLTNGALTAKRLSINATNFTLDTNGNLTAKNAVLNGRIAAESGSKKVTIEYGRMAIYYNNKELGLIGGNGFNGGNTYAGLNFDLEYTGDYMTWAAQPSSGAGYSMKWTYARTSFSNFTGGMLNAGCDIDMHYWKLRNIAWETPGITGTCNFVRVIGVASDGKLSSWSSSNYMQFKNGLLIGGSFA